jgi:hypothetical protein
MMMHRNRSVDPHKFAMIPKADIPRASFTRQFTHKTTFDAGYLVPIYVDEVLPGDTFNLKMTGFARLSTPITPVMDNMYLDTFFFFVPNRLIWDNWQKFMGEQVNPGDSISYVVPQQVSPTDGYAVGSLQDYMGLPTVGQVDTGRTVSHCAFWPRAYNLIWNEWFRDQNMQNSVVVDRGDSLDRAQHPVTGAFGNADANDPRAHAHGRRGGDGRRCGRGAGREGRRQFHEDAAHRTGLAFL